MTAPLLLSDYRPLPQRLASGWALADRSGNLVMVGSRKDLEEIAEQWRGVYFLAHVSGTEAAQINTDAGR